MPGRWGLTSIERSLEGFRGIGLLAVEEAVYTF